MRYRSLGSTGLKVSEISFGTIPVLQGDVPVLPDYFNLDDAAAIRVMKHAYNLGCNFYDTAIVPEYGDAEIKLGKFASEIGREKIIISDKARFFTGNEMYQAVEESTKNLGTYPDIYFIHQVDEDNVEMVFEKYGPLDALCELKADGKIRFTGIASHYFSVLKRGICDHRVDVLQGSGNMLECGMLDRLAEEKLLQQKGFILNKVYAAGILPAFFPVETLLSGVLAYPVTTALIGLGTIEQLNEAMDVRLDYVRVPFAKVMSVLEKSFLPIYCDRCQRCHCLYGHEIHLIFRQFNYYFLGKDYWALKKLDLSIDEFAGRCKSCTEMSCLKSCPKNLFIPDLVDMIRRLVNVHIRNAWI